MLYYREVPCRILNGHFHNVPQFLYACRQHEYNTIQHETTRVQHETTRVQQETTRVQNNTKFILIYLFYRCLLGAGYIRL